MDNENKLTRQPRSEEAHNRPISHGDNPAESQTRYGMGPFGPDQAFRHAITSCWLLLPNEEKSFGQLEQVVLSLVQRALKDFQEDAKNFGFFDTGK